MTAPQTCRYCPAASSLRPYLNGVVCPTHTPAAAAGRPEPRGQDTGPLPGAQPFHFRANDTALIDQRARASGKRASGQQRRASHAADTTERTTHAAR